VARVRLASMGEQGLVVELGDAIDPAVNARVRWLARAVVERLGAEVLEVVPTYRSLLLVHDPVRVPRARLAARVRSLLARMPADAGRDLPGRLVHVPACYGGAHGPDLDEVARLHGLSPAAVVERHAAATYVVYMLGFTPGFAYLGGLDEGLATPRLAAPRPRVEAGAIGIAGTQTGIYPVASPGGWRIVARTPLRLFDAARPSPFLFAAGDRVRFEPVDAARFDLLARDAAAGRLAPEIEEGGG